MPDRSQDLESRVAQLEAQMAALLRERAADLPRREAPALTAGAPAAPPPRRPLPPAPRPSAPASTRPARTLSPVILVAVAGACIFLLGAIFFLHSMIQRGWVGPEMRLAAGLAAGLGLTFGAARMILGRSRALGICVLLAGTGTLMFTLRWGSLNAHFFPAQLGFAGTVLTLLLAGGLAARVRSGGVLCAALGAALAAPLAFSQGGDHQVALGNYLAALMGALLILVYRLRTGERWGGVRWLAAAGTWCLLAMACFTAPPGVARWMFPVVALHLLLAGLWAWLPRQGGEAPLGALGMWTAVSVAATTLVWALWTEAIKVQEPFALVLLLLGGLQLGLVKPLRSRRGDSRADLVLLALALAHLVLAVPVALAWNWVGCFWGLFAALLALGRLHAERRLGWEPPQLRNLTVLALSMAILATLWWFGHWSVRLAEGGGRPFLNATSTEAVLAALAWSLLVRQLRRAALPGMIVLEVVVHLALALELGLLVKAAGGGTRAVSISTTLFFAASGALQWLKGLRDPSPFPGLAFVVSGYVWLGLASFKLLFVDMDHTEPLLRALAFLGVGAIFLGAALVANRFRLQGKVSE